jgi:hypothetical protein
MKKKVKRGTTRVYSLIFIAFIGTVVLVAFKWRETNKQRNLPSVLRTKCIAPSVEEILVHYDVNDVTSGRMNTLDLFVECQLKSKSFGFYDLIDRHSSLKPPVVAKLIVSFDKIPWNYSNIDQNIVAIVVMDKLLKFNPIPIQLGDSIGKVKSLFEKETEIGDIHYFSNDNCAVAIKLNDGIISKYIVVYCKPKNSSLSSYSKDIEVYLK